ncbi:hypothetical protein [Streptomyces sp. NPDC058812]|uniref:hypothetical protein n=1 Tax=unclassified Streptomyces TaxID=2593676 RepID=UPI003698D497
MIMAGYPADLTAQRQAHRVLAVGTIAFVYIVVMAGGTLTIPMYVLRASQFGFGRSPPLCAERRGDRAHHRDGNVGDGGTRARAQDGSRAEHHGHHRRPKSRRRRPVFPNGASRAGAFVASGVLVAASSGVNGFFSSLAPAFLREDLGVSDFAVIGVASARCSSARCWRGSSRLRSFRDATSERPSWPWR